LIKPHFIKALQSTFKDSLGRLNTAFKPFPDLNSYSKDPAFNYIEKPPETSLLDRFLSWLFSLFNHGVSKVTTSMLTYRIIQGICVLAVLFVLYKILSLKKLGLFRKNNKSGENVFSGDEKDFRQADFKRGIREAIAAHDYRNAVRLWYLQTLRDLSDRRIINWSLEKTNMAYLEEMRSNPHFSTFSRLTYAFEYTFYGKFDIPEDTYNGIEQDFESFAVAVTSKERNA